MSNVDNQSGAGGTYRRSSTTEHIDIQNMVDMIATWVSNNKNIL